MFLRMALVSSCQSHPVMSYGRSENVAGKSLNIEIICLKSALILVSLVPGWNSPWKRSFLPLPGVVCSAPKMHCRKPNFLRLWKWLWLNLKKKKKDSHGRNGTWVLLVMKLTSIQSSPSGTVKVAWIWIGVHELAKLDSRITRPSVKWQRWLKAKLSLWEIKCQRVKVKATAIRSLNCVQIKVKAQRVKVQTQMTAKKFLPRKLRVQSSKSKPLRSEVRTVCKSKSKLNESKSKLRWQPRNSAWESVTFNYRRRQPEGCMIWFNEPDSYFVFLAPFNLIPVSCHLGNMASDTNTT